MNLKSEEYAGLLINCIVDKILGERKVKVGGENILVYSVILLQCRINW